MSFTTREGRPEDADAICALLPRLADFDLPPRRSSEVFWQSDEALVRRWAAGDAAETFVRVGVDETDSAIAVALVTMNRDHFSGGPNAHLEVLVIASQADGTGVGKRLVGEVEVESRRRGADTMSLHVVGNNARARAVYASLGYREEMIRAIRFLDEA